LTQDVVFMVSLRVHKSVDYVLAWVVVLCPYLFGFSGITVARNVFLGVGLSWLVSNIWVKALGMHLALDLFGGVALMLAPYLFDYRNALSDEQTFLHLLLGLGVWAWVAATDTASGATAVENHSAPGQDVSHKAA
jgi:hypothetical protein